MQTTIESTLNIRSRKYIKENGIHFVPTWRLIGFCGANLAVSLYMGLTMYMAYYLNGFVGMAVVFASGFSTIMRLWDGITDPIIGFIVEKYGNRLGKTRFCLVVGGILLFINSFLMFNVTHHLPEGGITRSVFFTVFALLYYIGYTFLNISNYTGMTCITNDPNQRPIISILGTVLVRIARAVMTVVVANLVVKYETMVSTALFHDFWLISVVAATISIAIAFISIAPKDIPYFCETSKNMPKVKFSDYLTVLKENRPLQMMLVAQTTDKLAVCCKTSVLTIVLYGVVAGNFKLSGGWTMYTTIIGLIMMALGVGTIGRKLGMKAAMKFGSFGTIVLDILAICLWVFGDPRTLNLPGYTDGYGMAFSGFTFFTIGLFIITVAGSGFQMICSSVVAPMLADVNDYEASRSGKYIPGMVGTLFSFIDKMISSFGPLLVGVGFALIGFKDTLPDINTPYTKELLIITLIFFYGLEMIGAACNIIAMKFYDLTPEKMKEVQISIHKLRKEQA